MIRVSGRCPLVIPACRSRHMRLMRPAQPRTSHRPGSPASIGVLVHSRPEGYEPPGGRRAAGSRRAWHAGHRAGVSRRTHTTAPVNCRAASSTPGSAVVEVRAEITANVWQVPAVPGVAVGAGDTIAILESMKMEIPVEAPVAGFIAEIHVAPNDQVNEGDLIALIQPS